MSAKPRRQASPVRGTAGPAPRLGTDAPSRAATGQTHPKVPAPTRGASSGTQRPPMLGQSLATSQLLAQTLLHLRILVRAVNEDQLFVRASALTYTTVLSIVPFLAVAFSVLKGFDFQNTEFIRDLLLRLSAGREEVVDHIIAYISQTNVRTLGVVGVTLLFSTSVMLIANVENTFNAIWGVRKGRSWRRKVSDYITTILIVPLLTVAAVSLSATLRSNTVVAHLLENEVLSTLYLMLLKFAPYGIMWLALTFIYLLLPNTRVRPLPALLGGMVAGTIWQLAQWGYITFQVGAANYNAIYGSFAQLPLFLVWVYLSWVIVLFGAELCFVLQHGRTLESKARFADVSPVGRAELALRALLRIAKDFAAGGAPLSLEDLSRELEVPAPVLRPLLERLERSGMLARLEDEGEVHVLRQAPENLRLKAVLDVFLHNPEEDVGPGDSGLYAPLRHELGQLERLQTASAHNLSLAELLAQGLRAEGGASRPDKAAPAQ